MGRLTQVGSRLSSAPRRIAAPLGADRDQRRDKVLAWRSWYKTARWQRLRWDVLVRDGFTCRCGCGLMEADSSQVVADHIRPHRGDEALFWDPANLRAKAVAESKAKALLLLNREAAKGNVTAIKAVLAAAEKAELAILETAFGARPAKARQSARPVEAKPVAPGKKDQADRDAATAGQGTWWDNDLEPGKLN